MDLGRGFLIVGGTIFVLGLLMTLNDKIPFIGKLPGDIFIKRENFTFYFPITTSIIISLIVSLILRWFNK